MKTLAASTLALSLALTSTVAFAGGPVVIEEEYQPDVVVEGPTDPTSDADPQLDRALEILREG